MNEMINTNTLVSIGLILLGIVMLLFPPKPGNSLYGVSNKATNRDQETWKLGQRLYAYAFLLIGAAFELLGILMEKTYGKFQSLIGLIMLIGLWLIAKKVINKRLSSGSENE